MEAKRNKLPNARVVVTPTGRTPSRQNLLNALRRVQRKAGLKTWNVHSLRHGFCSHMTRSKVSIETVRRMAGHSNLATTARYLHADVDDIHEAMDLFSEGSK
jgi:site-specific recombinase XerD